MTTDEFLQRSAYPILNGTLKTTFNETLDELNFRYAQALIPFAVILGVFCIIGIVGNIIVLAVFSFSQEYRNTNFKIFVLCLAAVDLLSCITLIPAEIIKTRHFFSLPDHTPCKVKCFFNIFAMNAAAYILFVICIDRFRKVCQPLKRQIWPGLATKILLGVIFVSLVLSVPAPIMCGSSGKQKTNIHNTNITVYVCAAEEQYYHSTFRYIYKVSLSCILVITGVAFIVMYVLIMRTVIKHWGKRESGGTIRFESTRSQEQSADKVEIEHLTYHDDVFLKDNTNQIEGESHAKGYLKVARNDPLKHSKPSRKPSNTSLNHPSSKVRFSVKRNSSDASFRARILRRRSSSVAVGKLPYKTLIWFILTIVFLLTFIINAGLSFMSTNEHLLSPSKLFWFQIFFRLYFINNIINPIVYALLDKRFNTSCKNLMIAIRRKCNRHGH